MTIYRMENNKKRLLRVISVSSTFIGIGKKGSVNISDFSRLAKDLEPTMEGFTIMDI